jgi:hypothetical protein
MYSAHVFRQTRQQESTWRTKPVGTAQGKLEEYAAAQNLNCTFCTNNF